MSTNLPRIHQREEQVEEASLAIRSAISKVKKEYDITLTELLSIIFSIMQTYLKYALRQERHGETDTPAGVEKDT